MTEKEKFVKKMKETYKKMIVSEIERMYDHLSIKSPGVIKMFLEKC